MRAPTPREGMPDPKLTRDAFVARFLEQFASPAFDAQRGALDAVADVNRPPLQRCRS